MYWCGSTAKPVSTPLPNWALPRCFKVNVDKDGCLTIKLEHKDEHKDENKKDHYLRREFSYSNYEQALTLPDDVEKDKIEAKVIDGVLHIMLPRTGKAEKETKKIEVA